MLIFSSVFAWYKGKKLSSAQMAIWVILFPTATAILIGHAGNAAIEKNSKQAGIVAEKPVAGQPYVVQVVGLQWLNPLQRKDYPTEWQLLWTLGLAKPNQNDDMVRTKPEKYSSVQAIGIIASKSTSNGRAFSWLLSAEVYW